MNENELFKDKMSFEEMKKAFWVLNPYFVANKRNVGTFAKQHGYMRAKQVVNYKQVYFYLKEKED